MIFSFFSSILKTGMNIYARAASRGKRVQVSVLFIFFVLIVLSLS